MRISRDIHVHIMNKPKSRKIKPMESQSYKLAFRTLGRNEERFLAPAVLRCGELEAQG